MWLLHDCLLAAAGSVGGTVACESALRSAGTLLPRVRAPPSAPRPDGGPKSLRSLAIYKKLKLLIYKPRPKTSRPSHEPAWLRF
ncbi:hypothetical protein PoB_000689700 [Plakobranchus ocellatus]|uniref:Secreted protein n=1 Tax=Plakobranchus ocellatus TaxID=259542 RepID=A0AAV3YE34_9GAST|nr:hypothetical protein PoB_000689700 [Plakobranchus ocellatus]